MEKTKGILIIIGGDMSMPPGMDNGENSSDAEVAETEGEILTRFCGLLSGIKSRIEIIPTASSIPEKAGTRYTEAFSSLGFKNCAVMEIRTREQAQSQDMVQRVREAEGFLFTGGDQLRLTTILGGTDLLNILAERYVREAVVIAGTSAGAMAMSDTMIYQGSSQEALKKGEVKFSSGFGLLSKVIIDTHFVKRGRIGRLFQAVASNPGCLGIGLGEDTGLLITKGETLEAIGSGLIIVVDGSTIKYTNMAMINEGELISIENLSVHVMVPGDKLLLSRRKFTPALAQ
ncbi:cyanophycinase [Desulfonatronospira thiodismutans ASO3-1]|uniref:Cyanophycinase n=1 Tax=Desulfonatronospira thiodismutans ASO3-1 TaxID=555779 RepID=D6SL04_9BACT|nr:cyanophycinase [Desulfonatronospira thiodismutans]EFI35365.1 cyanophycinase [Desulfonatronospira thiodismutans ASO3-1]